MTSVGAVAGSAAQARVPDGDFSDAFSLLAVTGPLAAGTYDFGIECNQEETLGAIGYVWGQVAAVALPPN